MLTIFLNVLSRSTHATLGSLQSGLVLAGLTLWDLGCVVGNLILPGYKRGALIKEGQPGYKGIWPEYKPPGPGDVRCACPGLNALANHGLLPRDGRKVPFKAMAKQMRETFNVAPTLSYATPAFAAGQLGRAYGTGTADLSDLSAHNMIEHDASLLRHDIAQQPDQSKPAHDLIDALLALPAEVGRKRMNLDDIARFSSMRRAHSRLTNGQFTLSSFHKFAGSDNSGTLLNVFGGDLEVLRTVLKEERLPEGFEPDCLDRFGLTMLAFNKTAMDIEMRIREPECFAKMQEKA